MNINPKVGLGIGIGCVALAIIVIGVISFMRVDDLVDEAKTTEAGKRVKGNKGGEVEKEVVTKETPLPSIQIDYSKNETVNAVPEGATLGQKKKEENENLPPVQTRPEKKQVAEDDELRKMFMESGPPAVPNEILNPKPLTKQSTSENVTVGGKVQYAPGRYPFYNLSSSATTGSSMVSAGDNAEATDINVETFAPEGHSIDIILVNNVASNNFEVPVQAAVWYPFFWNGRRVLNTGDRILGKASSGKNRDRILVTFNKILLKDGRTLPIEAIGLEVDGTIGLKGFIVGNQLMQKAVLLLTEMAEGASEALQEQITTTYSSAGTTTTTTSNSSDDKLMTALTGGGKKAMNSLAEMIKEEIKENPAYVLVPAGKLGKAYLSKYVDLSQADYGK